MITKQVTLLDYEKLGLGFEVFASVKLQLPTRENLEKFEVAVADWPEVVECATVTGAVDYMLRVIARDMHAYDDFLRDKMLALGLVSDVQSRIVMRVPKRTTAAPLRLIMPDTRKLARVALGLAHHFGRARPTWRCGFDGGVRFCSRSQRSISTLRFVERRHQRSAAAHARD